MKTSKIITNLAAITAALGIDQATVSRLEKDGVIIKLDNNRYDLIKSIRRYIKRLKGIEGSVEGADYYAERARLTKAQADERELKIKIANKELIPIEVARRVWCDSAIIVKNNLLAVPHKVCHTVAPLSDSAEIAEEIKAEITIALESVKVSEEDYKDY